MKLIEKFLGAKNTARRKSKKRYSRFTPSHSRAETEHRDPVDARPESETPRSRPDAPQTDAVAPRGDTAVDTGPSPAVLRAALPLRFEKIEEERFDVSASDMNVRSA